MEAVSSYMDEEGQTWDCFPIENQPGLKGHRQDRRYLRPPEPKTLPDAPLPESSNLFQTHGPQFDAFGNTTTCPEGCIPLRRLTLENFLETGDLDLVFQKGSIAGMKYRDILAARSRDEPTHKYAYSKQIVQCKGSIGYINVWQPLVIRPQQVFSLAQVWVTAGPDHLLQSIEAGWVVHPEKFKTDKPVLFIYWTPDGYNTGSYNCEMPGTFVQTNSSVRFGAALPAISHPMGAQVDIRIDWSLINAAWWLTIDGIQIGYYPARLFGSGPLARMADSFKIGGEVLGHRTWPQMGSGVFPDQGFRRAAYIRNINYIATDGSIRSMQQTPVTPSPNCYKHQPTNTPEWQSGFFFGGQGGNTCL